MALQTTSRVQEFINTASVITKYERLQTANKGKMYKGIKKAWTHQNVVT